jgi:hypothetical protein
MKIFALLLLFTVSAQAQKTLSPQVFQASIRPVLSGIMNDFNQMVTHFPDFPKDIIDINEDLGALEIEKEQLRDKCPRLINHNCSDVVFSIQKKLASLQSRTMKLIALQKIPAALPMTNIGGIRLVNEFQADLEEIKGEIDNSAFMLKAEVAHKKESYEVVKKLDVLDTMLSLAIVEFVPYLYQEDFRQFYTNFVHPIHQHITQSRNYEFMNRNITALNFSLNLLNMNLTKRNKKTPEGMAPYLSLMHNRWNSILRYYY